MQDLTFVREGDGGCEEGDKGSGFENRETRSLMSRCVRRVAEHEFEVYSHWRRARWSYFG
jgi:hypothetical protein